MFSLYRSSLFPRLSVASIVPRGFYSGAIRHSSGVSDNGSAEQLEGERLIEAKLTARFAPCQVKVQDVSGGCGTFYAINIASEAFKGLSTVKQHRLVTETLKQDIANIHGLQIKTTPNLI